MAKQDFIVDIPVNVTEKLPWLSRVKFVLHCIEFALIFLTICIIAPLIADEVKSHGGSSPAPNYTLVVCIFTVTAPIVLVYFPWAYEHQNKFKKFGKFAMKPRTNLIFDAFNVVVWGSAGIAMTVHANSGVDCSDSNMCNLSRTGAAFAWLTCLVWLGSLICTTLVFWNEKSIIQQNLKQSRHDRLQALESQAQQEQDDFDDNAYHRPKYEMEEDDIGGMRPQSFEQARPLQTPPLQPPHHQQGQPAYDPHYQQPAHEGSPFEDPAYYHPPAPQPSAPYDPYDPHQQGLNSGFSMPDPARYGAQTPDPHRI
ncbi:hypothetical protein DM01DRAFT_1382402 [Hesseltinella vesiculosa]|uniref:MARVEL domain-containing protein n=1 Tax=Hesseltinella vesiculosa TaxID=101127 RepID=A0A1X2GME1_9FUNG|nr:hypothetical protein DM01DRAFT_1382402 [Hesseltinella vesiculosa]